MIITDSSSARHARAHLHPGTGRRLSAVWIALAALALSACGQSSAATAHLGTRASDLKSYLAAIEPIRLGVNALLNNADPIINGFKDKQLTDAQASAQMGGLEQSFADFTVEVNALQPADPTLASINAPYAHTFILEELVL